MSNLILSLVVLIISGAITIFLLPFVKFKVNGRNNLLKKDKEGKIVVFNHTFVLDPLFIVLIFLERGFRRLVALVKKKHEKNPIVTIIEALGGVIIVDTESFVLDKKALERVVEAYKKGKNIGISPEGTRSKTGEMQEPKQGILFILKSIGKPVRIVPVGIPGARNIPSSIKNFKKTILKINIGEPFTMEVPENIRSKEDRLALMDKIMIPVAKLLPKEQRGYYKDKI